MPIPRVRCLKLTNKPSPGASKSRFNSILKTTHPTFTLLQGLESLETMRKLILFKWGRPVLFEGPFPGVHMLGQSRVGGGQQFYAAQVAWFSL